MKLTGVVEEVAQRKLHESACADEFENVNLTRMNRLIHLVVDLLYHKIRAFSTKV